MGTSSKVRDGSLVLHLQNSKERLSLDLCILTYVPWIFRLGHSGRRTQKRLYIIWEMASTETKIPSFVYSKPKWQPCGTMPKRAQCVR